MKAVILSLVLFTFSAYVSAECSLYDEVPSFVEMYFEDDTLSNDPSDVVRQLEEAFEFAVSNVAEVDDVRIKLISTNGVVHIYRVDIDDTIWSAVGGSDYIATANTLTGVVSVQVKGCWNSGE